MYWKLVLGAMVEAKSKVHARMSFVSGDGSSGKQRRIPCHRHRTLSLRAAELSCQRVAFFGNSFSVQASTTEGRTL
jgi:hypothetical protein